MVFCVLFYLSYFGGIACIWEVIKYCLKQVIGNNNNNGLGPTEPTAPMRRRPEMNMRRAMHGEDDDPAAAAAAAPAPLPAPAPPPPAPAQGRAVSCIVYFTKVGEKYHTKANCGHVIGRTVTRYAKCGDCARLDD